MKRKYLYLGLLIAVVLAGMIVWMLLERKQLPPTVTTEEEWKVTMNLVVPENGDGACGIVTITLPENSNISAVDKLRDILGSNIGEGCQYWPDHSPVENIRENNVVYYSYEFGAVSENWLGPSIPPIRQDNVGENFCFYISVRNIVIGGTPWWDQLGCDSLVFTLILPENYDLRTDVSEPLGWGKGWYKDNQYSIFTAASGLEKRVENGRWVVEASWIQGEFDRYNDDLYLEVHYENMSY